uniref:Uncharacterized protein n=1 Tax=Anguilla anguilla TaxID=7936 RepID=A0A0E9VJ59_ANGAN
MPFHNKAAVPLKKASGL